MDKPHEFLPRWLDVLRLRVRSLFLRSRLDRELDEEFDHHLDRLVEEHVARGLTPDAARRLAVASMHDMLRHKEQCRDERRMHLVDDAQQDARYAWRQFRKNPGFVVIIASVLALAIGGNTCIFSIARAALAPLAIPDADRTVMVWTENAARDWHQFPASMPDVRDWRASGVFSALGVFVQEGFNVRLPDRSERVEGARVSPEYFTALQIAPARGRFLADADTDAVVISDRLWRGMFSANPDIVGTSAVVNGKPHVIAGVAPPRFPRFGNIELFALLPPSTPELNNRGQRNLGVIGRLRDGITLAVAQQRMLEVSRALAVQYPNEDGGQTAQLQPIQDAYVQDARMLLRVLLAAVACALAVACANVASLLLARGLGRRKELAIRVALGGGRGRLTRQLLTEHLLLALVAGAAAIGPAWLGVKFITSFQLSELENAAGAGLDVEVLAFNFFVAAATGIICGLTPVWLAWKTDIQTSLKTGIGADGGRPQRRLRAAFVVAEIALTAMLLIVGGIVLRSFVRVVSESPGYDPANVLTMRLALSDAQYASAESQIAFFNRVIDRASAAPGVVAASAAQELPTSDDLHGSGLLIAGRPEPRPEDVPLVLYTAVQPGYFSAIGIPVERGRAFDAHDTKDAAAVAIIDRWTANQNFPNQDPIGQRIKLGRRQAFKQVVGVVGNVEAPVIMRFLRGRVGQVYLPLAQSASPRMSLVVRASGDPAALTATMRTIVRGIDPDQPIFSVKTLDDLRAESRGGLRLVLALLSGFAALALLLATFGLYGTLTYDVRQRTREFGVRMSLGAQPSTVLRAVLRRGASLLLVGGIIGVSIAALAAHAVKSILYGIGASDPTTFAAAAALLGASGLAASYLPARRATKIDPVLALRCD